MATSRQEIIRVPTDIGNCEVSARVREVSEEWVFFLHGWGGAKEGFDKGFDQSGLQDYSLCALDLLGFGASDKPPEFSYDLADQARVVNEVISALGARAVYLVGHSMGGGVGLLSTQGLDDRPGTFISVEGTLMPAESRTMPDVAKKDYSHFCNITFPALQRGLCSSKRGDYRAWGSWMATTDVWAAYQSACSATTWSDSGKLLPMFKALPSKAYIYGQRSERVPYVLPALADVATRCIPDSEHFPMVDFPKGFYETLAGLIMEA